MRCRIIVFALFLLPENTASKGENLLKGEIKMEEELELDQDTIEAESGTIIQTPPDVDDDETPGAVGEETPTPSDDQTPAEDPAKTKEAEIADLEERARKAREQAEYWTGEKNKRRKEYFTEKPAPAEEKKPEFGEREPQESDFDDYSSYVKEWSRWDRRRESFENTQEQQKRTNQQHQQEFYSKWDDQVMKAQVKDPQVMDKGFIPTPLAPMLVDTDHFVEFAYYFAEHPAEATRICSLPNAVLAAREIGKLEAKFAAQPPQRSETSTTASSKPVGGNEAPAKDEASMSTAEWIAERNRKERGE